MRPVLWMVAILLAVGYVASEIRLPQSDEPTTVDTCWRRTENGWMRATWLAPAAPVQHPSLHPCVVGSLQLLLSTLALVAIPASVHRKRRLEGVLKTAFSPKDERKWHFKTRSEPAHSTAARTPSRALASGLVEEHGGRGGDVQAVGRAEHG